jgi:hypothetical protein
MPSIRLADVNGDGYADACGRNSTGVVCAFARPNTSPQFTPLVPVATRVFNANQWNQESRGATIRFADTNGDGRVDVCGRSTTGLKCGNN